MEQQKLFCGIDISSETIDVCIQLEDGRFDSETLPNNKAGFDQLLKRCTGNYHFVMESTGVYQLPLCFYLHEKNQWFSVVNALQIKRYIQMHLERNKSDKKDARYICLYGIDQQPPQYENPDSLYFECRALNNAIHTLTNEITAFKNKIHALQKLNLENKLILKTYKNIVQNLQAEMKKLDKELNGKLNLFAARGGAPCAEHYGCGQARNSTVNHRHSGL